MAEKIKVTVWNEGRHEKSDADAKAMYPNGIHGAIKEFLDKNEDMEVRAVTLDDAVGRIAFARKYAADRSV